MTVTEDGAVIRQTKRNDARVTRLGRVLRATSIDELPQLINVLRGQMSLVGPRPHAVAHDDGYATLISTYAFRQHVKPGLTGWAQVNGLRGETSRLELMEQRVAYDLWYIRNWSIWLDLRIIVLTMFELLRPRNAYSQSQVNVDVRTLASARKKKEAAVTPSTSSRWPSSPPDHKLAALSNEASFARRRLDRLTADPDFDRTWSSFSPSVSAGKSGG